jgi:hypothetical protein
MNMEMAAVRLELVAAKAKQLAEDLKNGRLWEGDLSRGIREIHEQLSQVTERK